MTLQYALASTTAADALGSEEPYVGYTYAYPHKTAYRPLEPSTTVEDAWRDEDRGALFLYAHVPFCEYRCGFCNLFTLSGDTADAQTAYVVQLEREARVVREAIGPHGVARAAIGGGTPTLLSPDALARVMRVLARPPGVPLSVECSPETVDDARISTLVGLGATRLSIGVQSVIEDEVRAVGRPQPLAAVRGALALLSRSGVAVNVDVMVGLPGQTRASLARTLEEVTAHGPEEVFVYPLYVRPRTGLDRRTLAMSQGEGRLALYRHARDWLAARGWERVSMRLFRRAGSLAGEQDFGAATSAPAYACQTDGMVGLGAGARSYTRTLHYSSEWAVTHGGVRGVIASWLARDERELTVVRHGIRLDADEQRRRFVLQSLLTSPGLDLDAYRARFATEASTDFDVLSSLERRGYAARRDRCVFLTDEGLDRSDAIGPLFYSDRARALSAAYEVR